MIFSLLPTVHLKIICLHNISPPRASSTYVEKKVKRTNRQDRYQIEKSICLVFWLDIHYKCKYHLQLLQGFVLKVLKSLSFLFQSWGQWIRIGFLFEEKNNEQQPNVCLSISLSFYPQFTQSHSTRGTFQCVVIIWKKQVCVRSPSLWRRETQMTYICIMLAAAWLHSHHYLHPLTPPPTPTLPLMSLLASLHLPSSPHPCSTPPSPSEWLHHVTLGLT